MRIPRFLFTAVLVAGAGLLSAAESPRFTNRTDSLKALCERLHISSGAVVADVGCGAGADSMVFASIVGERGTVLAEEIEVNELKKTLETATKRGFHQVVPILGQTDDPRLPDRMADLLYMHRVFHHFAKPRDMLGRLWVDLKPGGYMVVVDQQKGPLRDWAETDVREKQHHWTAETAVVRMAREEGFRFHDALEALWNEKDPFVLVFRKPEGVAKPNGDPDLPETVDAQALVKRLPLPKGGPGSVAFFGLDRGRALAPALRAGLEPTSRFFDIVLEEWALSRQEKPPGAEGSGIEVLRTEKGTLALTDDMRLGLVVFADAYHRLWDPQPLLKSLKQHMPANATLALLDRQGPAGEARRLAGHRRRVSPDLAIEEMRQAGFELRAKLPAPSGDRFFFLFGPQRDSP
jgi:ubiquinone/menaquinone biosynthesis C-methylase UbiE